MKVCPRRYLSDGSKKCVSSACEDIRTTKIMNVFPAVEFLPLMDLVQMAKSLPGLTTHAFRFSRANHIAELGGTQTTRGRVHLVTLLEWEELDLSVFNSNNSTIKVSVWFELV